MTSNGTENTAKVLPWRKLELSVGTLQANHDCGFHSVTPVSRYIYVLGSVPLHRDQYQYISFYIFDLHERKWSEAHMESGPRQRYGHSATLVDDRIYLFGGYDEIDCLNDVHVYDVSMKTWTEREVSVNSPRLAAHAAHFVEGLSRIFVVGGIDDDIDCSEVVYAYGIEKNDWLQCKAKGEPPLRYLHASCVVGSKIFLCGGKADVGPSDPKVVYVFDFSRGLHQCSWSSIALEGQLERPVEGAALVYVSQGRLLFFGELSVPNADESVFTSVYNLTTKKIDTIVPNGDGKIKTTTDGPLPRRNFGHVRLNNRILIFGGYDTRLNPIYELDISALC